MYDLSLGGYGGSITASLRLILGITLIFAGLEKVRELPDFVIGVIYYKVLPENVARWYGRLLPFVEIGAGALLLFGIWTKSVSILSIAMLVSFSIAVSLNLARKRNMPCFCFGTNSSKIGWHTLVRIFLLITASFPIFIFNDDSNILWRLVFDFSISSLIDIIPIILITVFGLLLLSLVEISPLVVRAWTSRTVPPANYGYSVVWKKHSREEVVPKT